MVYVLVVFSLLFAYSFTKPINSSGFLLPDLEVGYSLDNALDSATIYAFSGLQNNDIIENKKVKKYNQLVWYSLGYPTIKESKTDNKTILFHEYQNGFYSYLEMLTKDQIELFKQEAKFKYNVSIAENQIKNMQLRSLKCEFTIEFEINKTTVKKYFEGTVKQRNKYPLRIYWTIDSKDNQFNKSDILKALNEQNMDKNIECVIDTHYFDKISQYSKFSISVTTEQKNRCALIDTRYASERQFNNSISEIKDEIRKLNEANFEMNRQTVLKDERTNNSIKAVKDEVGPTLDEIKDQIKYLSKFVLGVDKVKQTLSGHTNVVRTLFVLPNGNLASGSWDNTIKIWNPNNGSLEKTLQSHTNYVNTLVVLPNGDLASGSYDNTIKIWDLNDGSLKRTFRGHTKAVYTLVVLHNGDLASGSDDQTIKIWNPNDGSIKETLTGHTSYVHMLVVLPNGDLASGSNDGTIIIWDLNDGSVKRTLTGHTHAVYTLFVLPNGYLASGSNDDTIKIWNPNDGSLIRTLNGHTHNVVALVVLPNGDLASGSWDRTIKIWNRNDFTLKRTLKGHTDYVYTLVVLPNGDLASGSNDKTIKIWTF